MFPNWQVGDIVTHEDGDLHRVIWTDSEDGSMPDEIEVTCIRSSKDLKYRKGDRETNVVWAFSLVVSAEELNFQQGDRQAA